MSRVPVRSTGLSIVVCAIALGVLATVGIILARASPAARERAWPWMAYGAGIMVVVGLVEWRVGQRYQTHLGDRDRDGVRRAARNVDRGSWIVFLAGFGLLTWVPSFARAAHWSERSRVR